MLEHVRTCYDFSIESHGFVDVLGDPLRDPHMDGVFWSVAFRTAHASVTPAPSGKVMGGALGGLVLVGLAKLELPFGIPSGYVKIAIENSHL